MSEARKRLSEEFRENLSQPGLKAFRCIVEIKKVICDEHGCTAFEVGDVPFNNTKEAEEAAQKALQVLYNEAKFAKIRR